MDGSPQSGSLQRNHPMALRCRRVGAVHSIISGSRVTPCPRPLCSRKPTPDLAAAMSATGHCRHREQGVRSAIAAHAAARRIPHSAAAPFGTPSALIDYVFRCQRRGTLVMTWKLALLVLASAAMLASTPASARHHRHGHGHFYFHGGQRYYSSPSAPGGGMLTPSAAWNH